MRKLTADFVFPITESPIRDAVVVVDEDDKIVKIAERDEFDVSELEVFEGIICPGFVNAHCHLELSHLKGKIEKHTGLPEFILRLQSRRDTVKKEKIRYAVKEAESRMIESGIVVVGDTCNSIDSFEQKTQGNIRYYNFIEAYGFIPEKANKVFEEAYEIYQTLDEVYGLTGTVTPHAAYSVSEDLFHLISSVNDYSETPISIHNQESEEENNLYIAKAGGFIDFYQKLGIDIDFFQPTGLTSLKSFFQWLPNMNKIQLVHNTYTTKDEIIWAMEINKNIHWCLCPNANLYIENQLPDIQAFIDTGAKVTIGTDSLASNTELSVLDELKTIAEHFPNVPLKTLLKWATVNGAEFLGYQLETGTIEAGKTPGLNLITNVDYRNLRLTKESEVEKLV